MIRITSDTRRRFILGAQGLWPGRRWKGPEGLGRAFQTVGAIQIDPLDVIGRSHDLALECRVDGYRPEHLDSLLYRDRSVFEYGGTLFLYPREALRLRWSGVRHVGFSRKFTTWAVEHAEAIRGAKERIRTEGPLSSGAFLGGPKVDHYRSRRLEGVALHYLWRRMEIMVHHREEGQKFYDLTSRLFGRLPTPFPADTVLEREALETVAWLGVVGAYETPYLRTGPEGRGSQRAERASLIAHLVRSGRLTALEVEGDRSPNFARTEDLPLLEALAAGDLPAAWKPLRATPEALLLAPLEVVSSRNRARSLFGFDHVWEVYKPAHLRRWGYYVVPVLLGDRIVGRLEPTFEAPTHTLRVLNAWWEPWVDLSTVIEPLALALQRTARRLGASRVDLGEVGPPAFRARLARALHGASRTAA